MSDHHHSKGPFPAFDSDDPLSMMGVAMVGMTLQAMAEQEERERRARLTPWQRRAEDERNRELQRKVWLYVGILLLVFIFLMCVIFPLFASSGVLAGS